MKYSKIYLLLLMGQFIVAQTQENEFQEIIQSLEKCVYISECEPGNLSDECHLHFKQALKSGTLELWENLFYKNQNSVLRGYALRAICLRYPGACESIELFGYEHREIVVLRCRDLSYHTSILELYERLILVKEPYYDTGLNAAERTLVDSLKVSLAQSINVSVEITDEELLLELKTTMMKEIKWAKNHGESFFQLLGLLNPKNYFYWSQEILYGTRGRKKRIIHKRNILKTWDVLIAYEKEILIDLIL